MQSQQINLTKPFPSNRPSGDRKQSESWHQRRNRPEKRTFIHSKRHNYRWRKSRATRTDMKLVTLQRRWKDSSRWFLTQGWREKCQKEKKQMSLLKIWEPITSDKFKSISVSFVKKIANAHRLLSIHTGFHRLPSRWAWYFASNCCSSCCAFPNSLSSSHVFSQHTWCYGWCTPMWWELCVGRRWSIKLAERPAFIPFVDEMATLGI